ncbi:MAG: DUF3857 domain-containing protein [Candidatus Krumholzibacteriia bacterium]
MSRLLATLGLLSLVVPVLALDTPALIAAAPPISAFAQDDVVVLYQLDALSLDEGGRLTHRVHTVRRLQTQWAMRSLADPRLDWDAARQDLTVLTARTYMRDGTVLDTPANGFNEVTPDGVARAVPFLDLREMVVTHIGTEPGCVVELEYEVRDREPGPVPAGGTLWLGGEYPVLAAEVDLTHLDGRLVGAAASDDRADAWRVEDLAAYAEVPRDQWPRTVPHVVFGATGDLKALAAPIARATDAAAVAGPGIAAWLAAAHADPEVLTQRDLLGRVATLVHDQIAAVAPAAGPWSRAPRTADTVLRSGVGTAWERAVVAVAILRADGLVPELGLFGHDVRAERPPLDPGRLDQVRVVTRIGDENWWLDPDQKAPWSGNADLPGATGLFLAAAGGVREYTVPPRPLEGHWTVHLAPAAAGWQAEAELEMDGLAHDHAPASELADALAAQLLQDGKVSELLVFARRRRSACVSLRLVAGGRGLAQSAAGRLQYQAPWPAGLAPGDLPGPPSLGFDCAERRHPGRRCDAPPRSTSPDDRWSRSHGCSTDLAAGEADASAGPLVLETSCQETARGVRRTVHLSLNEGVIDPQAWLDVLAARRRGDAFGIPADRVPHDRLIGSSLMHDALPPAGRRRRRSAVYHWLWWVLCGS